MQKCKIHIIKVNETTEDLINRYSIDIGLFQKMNPLSKNNKIHPGQLLYIPYQETTPDDLYKDENLKRIIKEIQVLFYEEFVAISLKQNHLLLLNEYYIKKIQEFAVCLWKNEENTRKVFETHTIQINNLLLEFEQALMIKKEDKISDIKKQLSERIDELTFFFEKNHCMFSNEKIKKWIENQLFLQAKILSKNYYDAYKETHE